MAARLRIIIVAIFILTGCVLSTLKAKQYNYRPYLYDNLYLPSGRFLNELSLGYREIVADMVWLSSVQYYGDYRKGNHDLLYFKGLIEIVTMLDPHFIFAYKFGALVLSQDMEAFDEAVALLKKGMAHNPTSWELPFEIGLLSYVDRIDLDIAAHYFDLSARLPGAPLMAKRFAAFVYSKGGHYETSLKMWQQIRDTADEPYMRELAERYIEKLKRKHRLESNANS